MNMLIGIIIALCLLCTSLLIRWLTGRSRAMAEKAILQAKLAAAEELAARRLTEQQRFLEQAQQNLKEAFTALSATALQRNSTSFFELAGDKLEERVKPLSESLTKIDARINALEVKREGAYQQVHTLIDQIKQSTAALDKETRSLVSALRTSTTRGRYGEIALRRLVEFAGMLEHCDFQEQVTTGGANIQAEPGSGPHTGRLRPDMIVYLPENRKIVVDSKVPLAAYLEVFETEDPDRQRMAMERHVGAVKTHIRQLSSKAYWDQFSDTPDFVVLFMQIESSFGAALQIWPGMIEEALNNRIIIATPTTLITILRSIGYSWSQVSTIENIEAIRDAAVELYERSATLMEHLSSVGRSLSGTIQHYNKAVGSLEAGFLPQGRKIQQLAQGFTRKPLPDITQIESTAREIVAAQPVTQSTTMQPSSTQSPTTQSPASQPPAPTEDKA